MNDAQSSPSANKQVIDVFFSYAHEDEELRDELAKHLKLLERQKVISSWYDRQITAGSEWAGQIDRHLEDAKIILLLISADFLASDYCYDVELKRAMERHESGEARVIPIILRSVDWKGAAFGKLQALPTDAKPVTSWNDRDLAFTNITKGLRQAIEEMTTSSPVATTKSIPLNPLKKETLTDRLNFLLNLWTIANRELNTIRDGVDRQIKQEQIKDLDRQMKEVQNQLDNLDNESSL